MFDNSFVYKVLFILLIPGSLLAFFYSLKNIKEEIPKEDRVYLDPLPAKLKIIWPLVNFFAFYIGERLPVDTLEKINKKLRKGGVGYLMSPAQFIGLRLTSAALMGVIVYYCLSMLHMQDWGIVLFGMVLGALMPSFSVNDLVKKREKSIIRSLPIYLDYLTMAVQAGMNMSGALQQAVDKGPEGPLRIEFGQIVRDMRAGMPKTDAMKAMAERLELKQVNTFVVAVIQAEKTGASVGDTLRVQSDQRRVERFQMAEKLAMQAPVKLIFPLCAFIFPTTFIILLFPIAMKLLEAIGD